MSFILSKPLKLSLLLGSCLAAAACSSTSYTPAEQEMADTMGASQYQPRTQIEREAVETQDLFAQAAFWSREYDLNPGDLEAALKLSAALRKMGNPTQALEISKTTRALYPRNTELIAEYSASLIALELGKDAISPLSSAVRQDSRNARLWSLLGAAHDQIGQFSKGREHYSRALSIAPNDSNILANVGLSYALEGDARTAEIWLRRAAQNPNASAHVRQNLALVLGLQGKYKEAESLAREDLNAEGAENNLAYLKSLRGGGRTYEALTGPQAATPQTAPAKAPVRAIQSQRRQPMPAAAIPQSRVQTSPYSRPQMPAQNRQGYMPPSAPNVETTGGAREAAMAAARRIQERGQTRTVPLSQAQLSAQQDVLSRIGQSVSPKAAPQRPTYAQMQAQAQELNRQAQMKANSEAEQARRQAVAQGAQTGYPPQAYPQPNPAKGYAEQDYPQTTPQYRAPARRNE